MGLCASAPSENYPTTTQITPSRPKPKPKPILDYYSKHSWSKNVLRIIAYWNRKNNNNIQLNADVESMIQRFSLNDLIIQEWKVVTFQSNELYEFSNVIINKRAILTVDGYDPIHNKNGGKLLLHSHGDFILENGSVITLNGKGYPGGQRWYRGYSYNAEYDQPSNYQKPPANSGGGGACKIYSAIWCLSSGGGGYGTNGEDGRCETYNGKNYNFQGIGGGVYGDKTLSTLHLGSGGGGSRYCRGGNGGGAVQITCHRFINKGLIEVSGTRGGGATKNGGGGSGGSLLIKCFGDFDNNNGYISCLGAESIHHLGVGGAGGDGRICIKLTKNQRNNNLKTDENIKLYNNDGSLIRKRNRMVRNLKNIDPNPHIILLEDNSIDMKQDDKKLDDEFPSTQRSILDELVPVAFGENMIKSLDDISIEELMMEPGAAFIGYDAASEQQILNSLNDINNVNDDLLSQPGMVTDLNNEGEVKYKEVQEWFVNQCGLHDEFVVEYYTLFVQNGFDNFVAIEYMTEKDLIQIGINKKGHRINIMKGIEKLKN